MTDLLSFLDPAALTALAGAVSPYVKDILGSSGDMLKDIVKDAASDRIKDVLSDKKEWKKAVASALVAFLAEFSHELDRSGLSTREIEGYKGALKSFLKERSVRFLIGKVMTEDARIIYPSLARTWRSSSLKPLPDGFDWARMSETFLRQTAAIMESDQELRDIVKTRSVKAMARSVNAGFDLSAYAEDLCKRYGVLKLDNLYPDPEVRQIRLTKVFVEQNVRSSQEFNPRVHELPVERKKELMNKAALKEMLDQEMINRERERFFQQKPAPVLEIIGDPRYKLLVILGDPGSGKSVLLDRLALQWAESTALERALRPVPLLIELKYYVRSLQDRHCTDLLDYLNHGRGTVAHLDKDALQSMLSQGEAWLLLDGFDEIFDPELRQQVAHEVVQLTTQYPQVRIVVTSRIIGYDLIASILRNGGFHHFMLQELEFEQQKIFLEKWHVLAFADPQERKEKYDRLLASIREVTSVRELAENPLLLTLMALLNRYRELPRDRSALYKEASRILLHQWNADKVLRDDPQLASQSIDLEDKQAMLRAVALAMQTGPKGLAGNAISVKELEAILFEYLQNQGFENTRSLARRMVEQLRERNYIICLLGDDYYAFVHRTFLEYFCASAWVQKYEQGENGPRLTLDQLREETFDRYWQDEKWHEVLSLIASRMAPNVVEQLLMPLLCEKNDEYKFRNVFLASSCFAVLRNRRPLKVLSKKIRQELLFLCHFDFPYSYNSWDAEANQVTEIRQSAVQELARGWKDDPETLPWLKTRAQQDEDGLARRAAVQELARGWKDDPVVMAFIKEVEGLEEEKG